MPLSKDPGNRAFEKDGSKNNMYCSLCYRDGSFLNNEISDAKQMQKFCIEKMKENGMNGILAWILTRGIPRLDRWN